MSDARDMILNGRLDAWRLRNPTKTLDCSNADFSVPPTQQGKPPFEKGADLSNIDFSGSNFSCAGLVGLDLSNSVFVGANFTNAALGNVSLHNSDLEKANFTGARINAVDFTGAQLVDTNLSRATVVDSTFSPGSFQEMDMTGTVFRNLGAGTDFSGCKLNEADFDSCELTNFNFSNASMAKTRLQSAKGSGAIFDHAVLDEANFTSALLTDCSMLSASLKYSNLQRANLSAASLDGADFYEAVVDGANFNGAKGLDGAKHLLTVRFGVPVSPNSDVRYFDRVNVSWVNKIPNWERIRVLGKLPLFGASYSALIAIPFLFYLLDIFNRRVDAVRAILESETAQQGSFKGFAEIALKHLRHEPIPALSRELLISTLFLGIGATLFAIFCPARIKEFSRGQWRDELGKSLIHYLPHSWSHPIARMACIIFYLLGGTGVSIILMAKLCNAFLFIVRN